MAKKKILAKAKKPAPAKAKAKAPAKENNSEYIIFQGKKTLVKSLPPYIIINLKNNSKK